MFPIGPVKVPTVQDTSQQHLGSQPPGSSMSSMSRSKNSSPTMYLASTAARWGEAGWRKLVRRWKGPCPPLTIHVIPGQILEGLIEQDDGQRHLEHHPPLPTTQWGHLENELVGAGRPGYRLPAVNLCHPPRPQWALWACPSATSSPMRFLLQGCAIPCSPSPSLALPSTQARQFPQ